MRAKMHWFRERQKSDLWWGQGMYGLALVTYRLGHTWAACTCWLESIVYHLHLTPLGLHHGVEFIRRHSVSKETWSEAKTAIDYLARQRSSGQTRSLHY